MSWPTIKKCSWARLFSVFCKKIHKYIQDQEIERKAARKTNREIQTQKDIQTETEIQTEKDRQRRRDIESNMYRKTYRVKNRQTDRQTQ